jgi:CheY-like chemotaxis protein
MAKKVREVLLVSNPYDAFIMEEDGRLAGRIIHEYRGLNLSRPPRLTWASTGREALSALETTRFDIVITMPRLDDMDCTQLAEAVRSRSPHLPVFLLAHATSPAVADYTPLRFSPFEKMYVWQGNTDLLLALIKSVEDRMNVEADTQLGRVPVIILVEDDPLFTSALLPLLYREIVMQTQRVMDDSINEEYKLLRMRARPKLLTAETFEEAEALYRKYATNMLCLISDVRFPKNGVPDPAAGVDLLRMIRRESPDIALLNLSLEENNRKAAQEIPAAFLNKQSPKLLQAIRIFFTDHLGFGDFIFRNPDGREVGRAHNLRCMEKTLPDIPDESLLFHASGNHFSTWFMARSEIELAHRIRPLTASDFSSVRELREYMIKSLSENRKERLRGAVMDFSPEEFDPDSEFVKIGGGSIGGKARGLAFFSSLLQGAGSLATDFPGIKIRIPKSLIITTDGFDQFMEEADLKQATEGTMEDEAVKAAFLAAPFPDTLRQALSVFLSEVRNPLAVRSSSLLEDSQSQPFAGIYQTVMVPNAHQDPSVRLGQLIRSVKLVFASLFLEGARTFSENVLQGSGSDKMAVMIQQLAGSRHGDVFYPAVSGVANSYNFYPVPPMTPEEGVVSIALGLGKSVVEGYDALRFSPKYPEMLPGFSTVDDILRNAQHRFFALRLVPPEDPPGAEGTDAVVSLAVEAAQTHPPVSFLSSRYIPEEHRIRDTGGEAGHPVVTFASLLKQKQIPLPQLVMRLLEIVRKGMGGPVEMEFALDLPDGEKTLPVFSVLQIRPAPQVYSRHEVAIHAEDFERAICGSSMALGNGRFEDIVDIVYVDPDMFDPSKTREIAKAIGKINRQLQRDGRKYILIGPGRWGSADPWLGIPVKWEDISGVAIIIETASEKMRSSPSQGAHFFRNITARGISYITIKPDNGDRLAWKWFSALPEISKTFSVRHVRTDSGTVIKIDGRTSRAVIYEKNQRVLPPKKT